MQPKDTIDRHPQFRGMMEDMGCLMGMSYFQLIQAYYRIVDKGDKDNLHAEDWCRLVDQKKLTRTDIITTVLTEMAKSDSRLEFEEISLPTKRN